MAARTSKKNVPSWITDPGADALEPDAVKPVPQPALNELDFPMSQRIQMRIDGTPTKEARVLYMEMNELVNRVCGSTEDLCFRLKNKWCRGEFNAS